MRATLNNWYEASGEPGAASEECGEYAAGPALRPLAHHVRTEDQLTQGHAGQEVLSLTGAGEADYARREKCPCELAIDL